MNASWANERALSVAIGNLIDDDQVWCIRPDLLRRSRIGPFDLRWRLFSHRLYRTQPIVRRLPQAGIGEDGVLAVWTTGNQQRALGCHRARPTRRDWRLHVDPSGDFTAWRHARELASRLVTLPALSELYSRSDLASELFLVHGLIQAARSELAKVRPSAVVLASQHSVHLRAYVLAAREQHIPVAYVPHAPLADNAYYADLPMDRALLRGELEAEQYVAWGADRGGLSIVGVPSLDLTATSSPVGADRLVIAPSPWPSSELEAFFDGVRNAVEQLRADGRPPTVVCCPHPRLAAERLRPLLPPGTAMASERRTIDELAAHGGAVVQHASGVALEAMAVGAPIVEFDPLKSGPNYPFMRSPHVTTATDAQQLAAAVERALTSSVSDRTEAMEYARRWMTPWGREAESRLAHELRHLTARAAPVLDGWRRLARTERPDQEPS